ncbi:hypothetical protein PL8927_710047 [Planktothrix serta PCC 8927]|uniref:Uncharacterized protein n=1 Tax=Planktothrix serta PCC 8927 TaxID=671068 RepID=A0A7Z9BXP9_9CYAN|nr:hypothetical protein PL8927_710047 [Planktothrix serta PCC 8927]
MQKKIPFFPAYAILKNEEVAFNGIDHLRKGKRSGGKALTL